jgi:hypothetical protein
MNLMELSIKNIVKGYIEQRLNDAIESAINDGSAILDNGRETYRFLLHLDAGDYKAFDNIVGGVYNQNKFTNYINGIVNITDSNVEGAESSIITFAMSLELLVPLRSLDADSTDNTELIATIRNVIDNANIKNDSTVFDGYTMGVSYSLSGTGRRDLKVKIGDSISLYCYFNFFFVENGVNSTDIKITIDGKDVPAQRIGYSRVATQEADVSSESQDGSATNVTASTVFTLNFDKPVQKTPLDDIMRNWLLYGNDTVHEVVITEPFENGEVKSITKHMIFNEVTRSTDTVLNASETVIMVEAMR